MQYQLNKIFLKHKNLFLTQNGDKEKFGTDGPDGT